LINFFLSWTRNSFILSKTPRSFRRRLFAGAIVCKCYFLHLPCYLWNVVKLNQNILHEPLAGQHPFHYSILLMFCFAPAQNIIDFCHSNEVVYYLFWICRDYYILHIVYCFSNSSKRSSGMACFTSSICNRRNSAISVFFCIMYICISST